MSMFSNLISKGAEVVSNTARVITANNANVIASNNNNNLNLLAKHLLTKLQTTLSNQLGENIQGSLDSFENDMLTEQKLQKTLIETKQKYHQLVAQVETQNESIKAMVQNLIELMKNMSQSLQNQDMLTPLKDLQTGFYACNIQKVDKQLKYFWKLYEAALSDHLRIHINSKSDQCKDQVNLFKGLNKNLQVELFRSRNNCSDLQKRVNQLHCKNQQLNQKIVILEKLGNENIILASNKDKQKAQQKQNELLQKIKNLQREKMKLQKIKRENQNQIAKVNAAIQVIKSNQDSIIQQMKKQINKKQSSYQSSISKICGEKINLEEKINSLQYQIQILKKQNAVLKQKQINSPTKKQNKISEIKQLNEKIKELSQQNQEGKKKLSAMVSKQIMKVLFLGFEDESKEWAIRRDVKNQIYLLLDIKPKKDIKDEIKSEERKWFGIF